MEKVLDINKININKTKKIIFFHANDEFYLKFKTKFKNHNNKIMYKNILEKKYKNIYVSPTILIKGNFFTERLYVGLKY